MALIVQLNTLIQVCINWLDQRWPHSGLRIRPQGATTRSTQSEIRNIANTAPCTAHAPVRTPAGAYPRVTGYGARRESDSEVIEAASPIWISGGGCQTVQVHSSNRRELFLHFTVQTENGTVSQSSLHGSLTVYRTVPSAQLLATALRTFRITLKLHWAGGWLRSVWRGSGAAQIHPLIEPLKDSTRVGILGPYGAVAYRSSLQSKTSHPSLCTMAFPVEFSSARRSSACSAGFCAAPIGVHRSPKSRVRLARRLP